MRNVLKGKLWIKLFLSFTLIILVSGGLIIGITTYRISDQFKSFVKNGDIVAARDLAPFIGGFYEMTGSWEGLFAPDLEAPRPNSSPVMRMRPMMRNMDNSRISMGPGRRIVITDLEGYVTFDSKDELMGEILELPEDQDSILIYSTQEPIGRLYIDSMIDPAMNSISKAFIEGIQKAVSLAVWPSLVLALALTLIMVRNITKPLFTMKRAAARIADGDLTVRTGMTRGDELGQLGRAFDDMAASLEAGEEWKRRIIADSAHELRTPVALLQGTMEMIIDGVYPLELDRIKSLYEETRHLTGLIASLQELAGLEAGEDSREMTAINLCTLAEDTAASFRPALEKKGGCLKVNGTDLPEVKGRYNRLKQVFINLYSNAGRYIPDSGVIEVNFSYDESAREVEVAIRNNGPEIPPEELERIFERFYRIEKSRNREEGGRGLGLAICTEIIKAHGGWIKAENLPEKSGVEFAFTIPVLL